jgi:hypothetical protein
MLIRWPLSLVVSDELEPVGCGEPEPQAAIRMAIAMAAIARGSFDVDLSIPQVIPPRG